MLKTSRCEIAQCILYYYDGPLCDRGGIVTINPKQTQPDCICVSYNENATLEPVGILLNDVIDTKRYTFDDGGIQVGEKASVLTKGWIITNKVVGKPKSGEIAVLYPNGYIGSWHWGKLPKRVRQVGLFMSKMDNEGYVKTYINIQ